VSIVSDEVVESDSFRSSETCERPTRWDRRDAMMVELDDARCLLWMVDVSG